MSPTLIYLYSFLLVCSWREKEKDATANLACSEKPELQLLSFGKFNCTFALIILQFYIEFAYTPR